MWSGAHRDHLAIKIHIISLPYSYLNTTLFSAVLLIWFYIKQVIAYRKKLHTDSGSVTHVAQYEGS